MEYVVVLLKPGYLHLIDIVLYDLRKLNLSLVAMKSIHLTEDVARYWRSDVSIKPYFEEMIEYHLSGPCIVMLWSGDKAIDTTMHYRGNYNEDVKTGFRGKYGASPLRNVLHVSNTDEVMKDIKLFFPDFVTA